jgi:HEAT repeat protein
MTAGGTPSRFGGRTANLSGGRTMARDILTQLCGLLKSSDAELQCAAARVLGALKTDEPAARQALLEAIRSGNQMVAAYAVDALAGLGGATDLPHLVLTFAGPGAARTRAIAAVAAAGAAALPALREGLRSKDAAIRRGALEALAGIEAPGVLDAFLETIFDPDPEAVRLATESARKRMAALDDAARLALLARLRKGVKSAPPAKAPAALAALMKLLGFLRRPEAVPDLLAGLAVKLPLAVRRNAIVSLEHLDLSGADAQAVAEAALPLLGESDGANLVSPALAVLDRIAIPKALAAKVQALRESPHPAVRTFATKALGTVGSALAADSLLAALAGPDFREREMAAMALRQNTAFIPRLAAELEKAKDPAHAWAIAGILRGCRESVPKPLAKKLLARGLKHLAKRDEEHAKAFVEVARFVAPEATRDALFAAGASWLKKGKPDAAEGFLRWLERDDLFAAEGVLALALARLKRAGTAIDAAARGANPAVPLFVRLLRRGDVPVAKLLAGWRKVLAPADLLYLGFHFLEQPGAERQFGAEALRLLVKAFPKSAEAKSARQRLAMEKA